MAKFCSACGAALDERGAFCSACGSAQAPAADAADDKLQACPSCGRPNWKVAKTCYSCGNAFAGGGVPVQVPAGPPAPTFPDISGDLPPHIKKKLMPGEPAHAFIASPSGCGTPPGHMIVTDTRVIVHGQNPAAGGGCGSPGQVTTEIPLDHVSGVEERKIGSGCSQHNGIAVASGGMKHGVAAKNRKEMEGALRILQALMRSARRR